MYTHCIFQSVRQCKSFKMFVYLCLFLVIPAVLCLDLQPEMLNEFKSVFHQAITQHLQAEYWLLQPIMAKQNESWDMCKDTVFAHRSSCRSCVESNCRNPISELAGDQWENMDTVLDSPGQNRADWTGWLEMGTTLFRDVTGVPEGPDTNEDNLNMYDQMGQYVMRKRLIGGLVSLFSKYFEEGGILAGAWSGFTNVLSSIGGGFVDTFSNIGNTIAGWFGRRRRSFDLAMTERRIALLKKRRHYGRQMGPLNDEARECVEQCAECRPHFIGEFTDVISEVCGEQMVVDEANMAATIREMQELFRANGHSILHKIEYNPSDFRLASLSFGEVYVTAMTSSGPVRYRSEYRFRMQSPQTSAIEMAEELINKWGL